MDRDLESLLKSMSSKPKPVVFVNNKTAQRAIQIMEDLIAKKIHFKPTIRAHEELLSAFTEYRYRYERVKNTFPFPDYLARRIVSAYDAAEFSGMIQKDENEKIKELELKIVELKERLARYEGNDKPNDTLRGDVLDEQ